MSSTTPTPRKGIKERINDILNPIQGGDILSRSVDLFISALIFFSMLAVIFETVDFSQNDSETLRNLPTFLRYFEYFSLSVFVLEYVLRIWSCTADAKYEGMIRGRWKKATEFLIFIDFLAIAPLIIFIIPMDLRFVRMLRMFRLFRLFKFARYSRAIKLLGGVLISSKEQLLVTLFMLLVLLIFASTIMFHVETAYDPNTQFKNIPMAMWWGVSAMTTVGYGDIVPMTVLGKLLGAVLAVLGVGIFALPAGIIASGFSEQLQVEREEAKLQSEHVCCPACGEHFHPSEQTEIKPPGG